MSKPRYQNLELQPIAGQWRVGSAGRDLYVMDPFTGESLLKLSMASREDLEAWTAWLDELGIEHSGVRAGDEPFAFATVVFRDPDNIQLELFAVG